MTKQIERFGERIIEASQGEYRKFGPKDDGEYVRYDDIKHLLQAEPAADPQSPFNWDACDEHETVFPKGAECPKCLVSLLREVLTEDDANVDTATTLSCELIDRIRAVVNGQAEPPTKPSEQKLLDHLFEVHHCNCDLTKL